MKNKLKKEKELKIKLWKVLEGYGVWQMRKFDFMSQETRDNLFREIYKIFHGEKETQT